ncbi:MAG: CBS domain-containing protein [Sphingomicrobium sp.]
MTIARILSGKGTEVATIGADSSLREAVGELGRRRIGALLVMDGDSVAGILSERDLVYCLKDQDAAALDHPVGKVMSTPAITVSPDTDVLSALALMTKRRIRHLPVVSEGRLAGIVSIGDLVKYRIERIESEAEAMRTYIQSV